MKTYRSFIFDSVTLNPDNRTINLKYSLDDEIVFDEILTLPPGSALNLNHPDLEAALFALHLSGGASYYKTHCPKFIEIRSGQLSREQAEFWNTVYTKGLGEFFYINQLDYRGLIKFPVSSDAPASDALPVKNDRPKRALVPFGGGKDSIVSMEILRSVKIEQTLFRVRPHHLIDELAKISQLPLMNVEREISPQLAAVQDQSAFQGHVPISAHISCLAVVVALLTGHDAVVFSNERSSSYGNVDYLGMEINHQWSKSLEFESLFRGYLAAFVTRDVQYLNVLRPLSELHIAKIFAGFPKYFQTATSCNRNWILAGRSSAAPKWCGSCPKCAFSFSLLGAYLPAETIINIFAKNLYKDADLLPLYEELWGIKGFKPFECVGTPEEALVAANLGLAQRDFAETPVLKAFVAEGKFKLTNPDNEANKLLTPGYGESLPQIRAIDQESGLL